MKKEDLLAQCLTEMESETGSVQDLLGRYAQYRREIEPLLQVSRQLEELPKNIALSQAVKARLRAQLTAEARRLVPARSSNSWWEALRARGRELRALHGRGSLLARPAGVALSMALVFSLLGVSTVSAAMDSIPGDSLYPVKIAAEQTRLTLALTDLGKAETYLWIASSRVGELSKITEAGKLELAPQVIGEYQQSVAQALRLSATQKQEGDKLYENVTRVQTSLQLLYQKAPESLQIMLAQTLTLASTGSEQVTGPAGVPPDQPSASSAPPAQPQGPDHAAGSVTPPTAPATSGLPPANPLPKDKGGVTAEPSPVKGGPISTPPAEPSTSDGLPPKGDIGPAPGPVTGKDTTGSPPGGTAPEPTKGEPVPTAPNSLNSKEHTTIQSSSMGLLPKKGAEKP